MGPTSTWSFFRRLVALVEANVTQPGMTPSDPFNVDGTAFRLKWSPVPPEEPPDVSNLPPADYATLMFHTVKYHLGFWAQIIHEPVYLARLAQFESSPHEVARRHRLWFIEHLLILAFGASFTTDTGPLLKPAGSAFAARALSLIPDFAQLHEDGIDAVEVLALAALYCHSVDMRVSAYQFVRLPSCFYLL